jgi:integrase
MKTTAKQQELQRVGECLYRSQTSKRYYAIIKRGGKQIKRSLKTTDAALARRRLSDLQAQAVALSRCEDSSISFTVLADRWLKVAGSSMKPSTKLRAETVIKSLNLFLKTVETRRITKVMLEDWAETRSKQISARTFNYEREALRRILDYALREGVILENPALVIKKLKSRKLPPIIPTKQQFQKLISTMRDARADALPAADLCEFLAYSGCRLGEGVSVCWGDVDFERNTFTVSGGETGTKNYEARVVPLFPALEAFLERYLEELGGMPSLGEPISPIKSAKKAMMAACKKAELPHFTHHHLRHFFCSNAIEAGIDFKTIAGWLGHKDGGLLVAKTYGHLRDEHSAVMAQRMTFGVSPAR